MEDKGIIWEEFPNMKNPETPKPPEISITKNDVNQSRYYKLNISMPKALLLKQSSDPNYVSVAYGISNDPALADRLFIMLRVCAGQYMVHKSGNRHRVTLGRFPKYIKRELGLVVECDVHECYDKQLTLLAKPGLIEVSAKWPSTAI